MLISGIFAGNISPVLALDAPTLLTPLNTATITAAPESGTTAMPPVAIPEFTWGAVDGASTYRIQFSQDIAFTVRSEFTTPFPRFSPISVSTFTDGVWYWRVRVDTPVAGQYSDTWSFTRQWASPSNYPVLLSPDDGATLEFFNAPAFTWEHAIGAAHYRFQVSSAPEFTNLLLNITTVTTTYQPTQKLANGSYYWRVVPLDSSNRVGTSSQTRIFTLGYNRVPALLEPANNALPTFTPTFRWTAVEGASQYRLQYSTDSTFASSVTQVDTRNTTYTPNTTLPNDINYYWRVRAHSGNSITDWSTVRTFRKQWYIKPVLLTPVNLYQQQRFPFFSWTPVPGASYYRIEIDMDLDFVGALSEITSNPYYMPRDYSGVDHIRYWRVTPYDKSGNKGRVSEVFSYISDQNNVAPQQIYPLYYYVPSSYPSPDQNLIVNPHEDRTVALPIFIWQRVTVPYPVGGAYAPAYRIEVDDDPLFGSPNWTEDTENIFATPTAANPFAPLQGVDYYWRVCPLSALGSACIQSTDPSPVELWSQVWRARFDADLMLVPTTGVPPVHIRPVRASEHVESTPVFEWWPVYGADSYTIQISDDPNFASYVISDTVNYPAYAPTTMLAQRDLLNRLDYGTYYWRVRPYGSGVPLTAYSTPWRFQVASQSHWLRTRTEGAVNNQLQIASDPTEPDRTDFDLTKLYAAQASDNWFFGFESVAPSVNVTYTLYIDVDHADGSGASYDARGLNVTASDAHLPEYAIYIFERSGVISAAQSAIYAWTGSAWGTPNTLAAIGGSIFTNPGFVELKIPNTAIGMNLSTGSYALSLMSFHALGGDPQDSVPSDPAVPGTGAVSRFASVSERMMIITPPNNAENDPTSYASFPPFFWENPTGSNGTAPWAGCSIEVNLDPLFTGDTAGTYVQESTGAYYASTVHHWPYDPLGSGNTYYWRIRPRYLDGTAYLGVWSQPSRLERAGFTPQNLQQSVTFATPTFSWDIVEGAESYDIQVDSDPSFATPDVNINTTQNSYTPVGTLEKGVYYWRVRAKRYNNVVNDWSVTANFTLTLPAPQGLTPDDPGGLNVIGTSPTLCWTPLIVESAGEPVLAAAKYRVMVSRGDPTFSNPTLVDTEQSCWTPTVGYDDGTYYWRVAMYDGMNKLGDYSVTAQFTKQYPRALPLSPVNGDSVSETPTFEWTAVDHLTPYVLGAATYKLEISQSPTFSPVYDTVTTSNTRYTPTRVYPTSTTYYWRVAILDGDNEIGPFSDATVILDPNAGRVMLYLPAVLDQ